MDLAEMYFSSSECNFSAMFTRREASTPRRSRGVLCTTVGVHVHVQLLMDFILVHWPLLLLQGEKEAGSCIVCNVTVKRKLTSDFTAWTSHFTNGLRFLQMDFTFYKWTSLFTNGLHFLQMDFTFLQMDFTFYKWTSRFTNGHHLAFKKIIFWMDLGCGNVNM